MPRPATAKPKVSLTLRVPEEIRDKLLALRDMNGEASYTAVVCRLVEKEWQRRHGSANSEKSPAS